MDRVPPFPYRDFFSSRGHASAMKKALDVRSDFNVILVVGEHATFPRPIIFFPFSPFFPLFLPARGMFALNYYATSFRDLYFFFSFLSFPFFSFAVIFRYEGIS